jgi:hypothetical protein
MAASQKHVRVISAAQERPQAVAPAESAGDLILEVQKLITGPSQILRKSVSCCRIGVSIPTIVSSHGLDGSTAKRGRGLR